MACVNQIKQAAIDDFLLFSPLLPNLTHLWVVVCSSLNLDGVSERRIRLKSVPKEHKVNVKHQLVDYYYFLRFILFVILSIYNSSPFSGEERVRIFLFLKKETHVRWESLRKFIATIKCSKYYETKEVLKFSLVISCFYLLLFYSFLRSLFF